MIWIKTDNWQEAGDAWEALEQRGYTYLLGGDFHEYFDRCDSYFTPNRPFYTFEVYQDKMKFQGQDNICRWATKLESLDLAIEADKSDYSI